jgi:undecaprenyl-diphosphatase
VYCAFACFIGYSRIYVGVHYPADVVAGAVVGMAVGVVVILMYRRGKKYIVNRQSKKISSRQTKNDVDTPTI